MTKDDKRKLFFDKLSAEIEQMKKQRGANITKDEAIRALLPVRVNGKRNNEIIVKNPRLFKFQKCAFIQIDRTHCFYCNKKLNFGTIDHIIPTSRQGANNAFNRIYSCSICNGLKADYTLERFIEIVARYTFKKGSTIDIINQIYTLIKYRDEYLSFMINNKQ